MRWIWDSADSTLWSRQVSLMSEVALMMHLSGYPVRQACPRPHARAPGSAVSVCTLTSLYFICMDDCLRGFPRTSSQIVRKAWVM